jgi:hypothetical protein
LSQQEGLPVEAIVIAMVVEMTVMEDAVAVDAMTSK